MSDIAIGDEVLAPWMSDGFAYPAIVVAVEAGNARVAYLDGAVEDVPLTSLRRGQFAVGTPVLANWNGKGTYYRGVIGRRIGQAVWIDYENGDEGWVTIAQCRLQMTAVASLPWSRAACGYCGEVVDVAAVRCDHCGAPLKRG